MIRLARFLGRSISGVNGPGERSVVWVQGCPLRCRGCFNPDFLAFGEQAHVRTVSEEALVDTVLTEHAARSLAGVTFSGGEPMAQAESLAEVAWHLRQEGLSVVVFTGYTWRHLQHWATPDMERLLAQTDLLVAGPYVEARRNSAPGLAASTNQEVIHLTGRAGRPGDGSAPSVELQVGVDGAVHVTGFPSAELRATLEGILTPS